MQEGGGEDLSAGVSHAAEQLLTHTHYDGLMGVTTTPQGKQRDEYKGQSKDNYDLIEAKRIVRQQLELLDQRDLHAAAAHEEAKAVARAEAAREADRVITETYREAERVIAAADRARAESDRAVARERLLLQHRQEELNSQRYPVGTPTGKSNLSEHSGDAPPWRNGRPDRVATEGGAHMRGEQKLTYKKAGQFGGGFC